MPRFISHRVVGGTRTLVPRILDTLNTRVPADHTVVAIIPTDHVAGETSEVEIVVDTENPLGVKR